MGRALTPLEAAFVLYHTAEGLRREQERARALRKEDWAVALLTQHLPEKARAFITQDEEQAEEPPGPDPEQFLIEDPWFSDRRPLHERLGLSPEQVQQLFGSPA